ncbi:probable pectinesterase/pectinesterase inhibitor 12 [Glycine soja]|uniref:Pectinesterase n=1 Tax=Glycine soja TaxID=3848 RepID=A0A0B2PMZ8_GLYSO|nr:probable pectinesterase/pectinesterase inhibitor 12 [Glycine soja]KHN10485.1 Putative pectinesterase/pectinesterase inhibitor 12 [Glycine soja]RZB91101.1 putative pectinesterase/pectinesterase inhibitor 12 [Glycine soja]
MAYSSHKLFFLLFAIFFSHASAVNSSNASTTIHTNLSSIKSFCTTTAYPEVCFNSLKLSISINISPNIINYLRQSLQVAISETTKLSNLFHNVGHSKNIIEKQRGSVQDCRELHQSTLASLKRSLSGIRSSNSKNIVDARSYLSAALTNKNTCLEGLDSASGTMKPSLVKSVINTYKHVSNSLSMLPKPEMGTPKVKKNNNQPLKNAPKWVSSSDQRLFQDSDGEDYDPNEMLVVAADGTGNFSTITEAINFAPNNSMDRIVIYVKEGIYEENVEIPSYKTNIMMLGDGSDVTFITGNRSVGDGWTTFRSATLAVSGDGFLARDIAIENSAGPEKHQAVALRVNADLAAFYRCAIYGYQDTLYVHSFRQFYRECDIYGTIDYIFGNAAAILQECNIISRKPMPGQFTVITAQSRDSPDEDTGISFQNCSIIATLDLYSNSSSFKSYLGRPWRIYSRTVYLESYIDDFIDPKGWTKWSNEQGLETLYYGEYDNYGPGSSIDKRVQWLGYHLMDYGDAYNFTVSEFINGDGWLDTTSVPYDDGI